MAKHNPTAGFQIRFDGPPGHEAPRFVEAEDLSGRSVRLGEWVKDGEYWLLRVDPVDSWRYDLAAVPAEEWVIGLFSDGSERWWSPLWKAMDGSWKWRYDRIDLPLDADVIAWMPGPPVGQRDDPDETIPPGTYYAMDPGEIPAHLSVVGRCQICGQAAAQLWPSLGLRVCAGCKMSRSAECDRDQGVPATTDDVAAATKAYEEGFESGRTTEVTVSGATFRRPLGLNPYNFDTTDYTSWNEGFYDGYRSREKVEDYLESGDE